MNKKLIGLLLALCLVIGLLPAMAIADSGDLATPYVLKFGYASYELKKYDTPVYIKNSAVDTYDTDQNAFTAYVPAAGTASNWSAKLEWKSGEAGPTLTLNGFKYDEFNNEKGLWRYRGEGYPSTEEAQTTAITTHASAPLTIVITGEDSLIETKFGIPFNNALTIKSEGAAKLDMNLMSGGINGASGCGLTIDANLDVDVASYYSSTMMVVGTTAADITINGGNINLTGTTSLVALRTATSGNININGGNVYAKGGHRGATTANADDHININGGSAAIAGGYSAVYKAGAKATVTIPDGADVEIMTGTKTDGSNATVKETIGSACYIKVTHKTVTPPPVETTAPATETTAPVQTSAPAVESSAPVQSSAPAVESSAPATETTAPTAPAELTTQVSVRVAYTNYKITKYDTPVYSKNVSKDAKDTEGNAFTAWEQTSAGADESNYNMKFVWHTGDEAPTLYLRGFKYVGRNAATGKLIGKVVEGEYTSTAVEAYPLTMPTGVGMNIIITGEDSLIEGQFGLTFKGDTTITSEGNAKLVMNNGAACITSADVVGKLTINANLDLRKSGYYNTAFGAAVIQTYKSDLIINGGTIVATTTADKSVAGIAARAGGNLIINGGDVTAHGIAGQSPTNGSLQATAGKVIINGGKVKATAKEAVPVYGLNGIEINGGEVEITSPYYGMNSKDGDVVIKGGKVTIISANGAFYGKAPVLGAGVDGMAGNSEGDADYYDETKYRAKWLQLTYTAPGGETTAPGGETTAPGGNTTAPGGETTAPSNPGNNPATGDSGVTMFIVMLLVGMFGIVATVAFGKKRAV